LAGFHHNLRVTALVQQLGNIMIISWSFSVFAMALLGTTKQINESAMSLVEAFYESTRRAEQSTAFVSKFYTNLEEEAFRPSLPVHQDTLVG
jgi:hypothetical protein